MLTQDKTATTRPDGHSLTSQEAADMLGISCPAFVKLMEDGKLPFQRASGGRHRRVLLRDVLEYQNGVLVGGVRAPSSSGVRGA
ncbi:MAG: helix-turn-helix domain-containing protein [Actinomycetaceae bacterium]|nr:helix-turn-helix domain-containing protein [Actinomycetaceae bacterium]MDU0970916.1 helix-turn-helix domain-containing protein [Actinomycetaceae bacterium]